MSDTNVIIHIFPGEAVEKEGTFDDMRTRGLVEFKNYLLTVLGHVGISFPPEKKIYGFGDLQVKKIYDSIIKNN